MRVKDILVAATGFLAAVVSLLTVLHGLFASTRELCIDAGICRTRAPVQKAFDTDDRTWSAKAREFINSYTPNVVDLSTSFSTKWFWVVLKPGSSWNRYEVKFLCTVAQGENDPCFERLTSNKRAKLAGFSGANLWQITW